MERSTFYRIITITTNTINGKEVTKLLGILQYNFAMKSMNLKDNTHTHTYIHMSRNDKQRVGNTGEIIRTVYRLNLYKLIYCSLLKLVSIWDPIMQKN